MNQRLTLACGVTAAGVAVGLGAFGAHALKDMLESTGYSAVYDLAVSYQFYHAFALLFNGLLMQVFASPRFRIASWFFTAGIIFFSGSLYVLSLTGIRVLGAITPVGGVFFMLGWIFILLGIVKK